MYYHNNIVSVNELENTADGTENRGAPVDKISEGVQPDITTEADKVLLSSTNTYFQLH